MDYNNYCIKKGLRSTRVNHMRGRKRVAGGIGPTEQWREVVRGWRLVTRGFNNNHSNVAITE